MSTDRPRPPSVERLLAAIRPRDGSDGSIAVARCRGRARGGCRRAGGACGRRGSDGPVDDLAAAVASAPRGVRGSGGRASPRSSTRPGSSSTRTSAARRGRPRPSRRRARAAAPIPCSSSIATTGRRGPRFRAAEEHLIALTGAEDALVTVNNAAALLLAVGLAGRRGVAVSRGELVEIGGGVRIPEIIRRAGARLIEVGTTNRTRAADFEAPLAEGRATVVLRVHPVELRADRVRRGARRARARPARPRPRRDRHRRPRQRRAARHRGVRPRARADAARAPRGRRRPGHVQRRQAGRWPAGRADRRSSGPHRPDPAGPAGPRGSTGEGDAGRARRDARASTAPVGRRPRSRSGG